MNMDYTADNFMQEDNFCRIDIDRKKQQLVVKAFDKRGELIEEETQSGQSKKIEAKLKVG